MDSAEVARSLEEAHECLRVAESPWFQRYLTKLSEEALKPAQIGRHEDMIANVARANALKDMRAALLDDIAKARSFIRAAKEE